MNYTCPSNPLHQSDELLFQISQDMLQLIPLPPSLSSNSNLHHLPIKLDKTLDENNDGRRCNENHKKIIHREIEWRRRQDMASLYSSLRSILPLQYRKGKRSISDRIEQATNYIKLVEKKIKELGDKRDRMKRSSSNSSTRDDAVTCPSDIVIVRPCLLGFGVVLSSSLRDGMVVVPLSRVFEILLEEGLDVVNCVSSKVNTRSFYTIQSEVSNSARVDASALQQKLTDLVKATSQILT